ncbi:hypothetical protein CspHIS471_0703140 [Cutaneotrichosporon sp. HIS471]|nr:hypothetical protein CspHIS471_0703140 [Cutaneotrichosporon sp. HIS471]
MSRPNSEYDLEDDPSTYQDGGTYPTHFAPYPIYSQRELQTPPPVGYPPFHSSPSGTFGPSTPQRRNAPDPSTYGPVSVSPHGVPVGGVVGGVAGMVAPAPSQMALPGPPRRPDGRIPAPKLLVDTKAPFENVPLSAVGPSSHPLSTIQTPLSTLGGWSSGLPTPLDRAPSTRALSPESTFIPPSRSTSRGAAFTPVPTPTTYTPQRPATAYAGPSYSRPLVTRQASRSDDRPSALPYAGNAKEEPGLQRGRTIIRHADAGAFEDAVPDDQGEVHLPPAYDEIYAPNP